MKKIILIVLAGFLFVSCGITKKASETDNTQIEKTIDRKTTTRPGDTITIEIPNVRFKDTTITRINYETKTIASVHYDKDGNQRFECLSAELKEEIEMIRETIKNDIVTKSETKHEFNPQHFVYALAVLIGVLIIAIVVGMVAIAKIKKTIPDIVTNVLKNSNN